MKQLFVCLFIISCLQALAQKTVPPRVPVKSDIFIPQPGEQCSVTVSAPFDTGLFIFIISVTITGPCSDIKENGEALAWQLLWQLFHFYKAYN